MHLAEKAPSLLEAGGVKGKGWRRRGAQPGGTAAKLPHGCPSGLLKPAVGQVVLVGKEQRLGNPPMPVNPPSACQPAARLSLPALVIPALTHSEGALHFASPTPFCLRDKRQPGAA